MVVCICNDINDSQIKKAIDDGESQEDFQNNTGCSQICGSCLEKLEAMYKES